MGSTEQATAKVTKKNGKVKRKKTIRRFKVCGAGNLDCYVEAKGGAKWLQELDNGNYRFFSPSEKRELENKGTVFIINMMRLRKAAPNDSWSASYFLENCVDKDLAKAFDEWYQTVFLPFVKGAVDENQPVPFDMLDEVLTHVVKTTTSVRPNLSLEVDDAPDGIDLLEIEATPPTSPLVHFASRGTTEIGRYSSHSITYSFFSGQYLNIEVLGYVWLRNGIKAVQRSLSIYEYEGKKTLHEIGLTINPDKALIKDPLERGRRVVELNQNPSYVQTLSDYMEIKTWAGWRRVPAQGRAMIDQVGMLQTNPDSEGWIISRYGGGSLVGNREEESEVKVDSLKDEDFALIDPYVFGFSFVSKMWGRFHVDHIGDIKFRSDAFKRLVMEEDDKNLILSIVKNIDVNKTSDFITGKGGGCVFLLHGAPGLGKTLTAEAVAEQVQRPLYAVSVGELGVDVDSLENRLGERLQLASRWNAVLLLDEADVFLEARTRGDVERNAMVGTFLRLLEYYNGILVLTSNRARAIDPAFFSRVSFAKKYYSHTPEVREKVVRNLLEVNGVNLTDDEVIQLSAVNVNGRQFKNSIRLAGFIAESENREASLNDILRILTKVQNFQKELEAEDDWG